MALTAENKAEIKQSRNNIQQERAFNIHEHRESPQGVLP